MQAVLCSSDGPHALQVTSHKREMKMRREKRMRRGKEMRRMCVESDSMTPQCLLEATCPRAQSYSTKHAHKSWRSDVPIFLPGLGRHTGGSPSKPTVHPCSFRGGGCGLLTSTPAHNNDPQYDQQSTRSTINEPNNTFHETMKSRMVAEPRVTRPWQ